MLMLMPPYHGTGLRADEKGMVEHFARVAEAARHPDHGAGRAAERRRALRRRSSRGSRARCRWCATSRSRCRSAAAKLRALIEAGGEAIEGPFDGEESITLMADLDAGATGTMPSALLPDLIKPVLDASSRRPPQGGRGGLRAHPAADQLREPPMRAARHEDRDDGGRRDQERRRPPPARAAAPGDPRRAPRARARGRAARAALGEVGRRGAAPPGSPQGLNA